MGFIYLPEMEGRGVERAGNEAVRVPDRYRLPGDPRLPELPLHRLITNHEVRNVEELRDLASILPTWMIYRGQPSISHRLEPSIERENPDRNEWLPMEARSIAEAREENVEAAWTAAASNYLYWLGIARHAGKPVRLLDFTRRLAVAVYFAIEKGCEWTPTVWAVDGLQLSLAWTLRARGGSPGPIRHSSIVTARDFNSLFPSVDSGYVAAFAIPDGVNRRMEAQSGLFLAGMNMKYTLAENVFGALGYDHRQVQPIPGDPQTLFGYSQALASAGTRERIASARIVRIMLKIPEREIREYLLAEGVTAESLRLNEPIAPLTLRLATRLGDPSGGAQR